MFIELRELSCSGAIRRHRPGYKGAKTVRACTIRDSDLGTRRTFESSDLRSKSTNHYKERRFVMAVDFHLRFALSGDSEL